MAEKVSGWGATPKLARGPHGPSPLSPLAVPHPPPPCALLSRVMLEQETPLSQRDMSLPAQAVARARVFEGFSLHGRARLAACQGHGASIWLSALPTSGARGTCKEFPPNPIPYT